MTEAIRPRIAPAARRSVRLAPAALVFAALLLLGSGSGTADARVTVKPGSYAGKTTQTAVSPQFRRLTFRLKKGKVTLTAEPVVARGLCLSTPVFTLDGSPKKKLSGRGTFTFTHTYVGSKFDKIGGRFVSPTEVEGYAIYHFPAQDLCSAGKTKVTFTAKRT